jgi:SAM-dependent methyltransferase
MRARFEEALRACADVSGKRILDVGCGSGRYSIELAERGAEVVGIDCSKEMLRIARNLAGGRGVAGRCRFIQGDFLNADCGGEYDLSLAIGFFDYARDASSYMRKLRALTAGRLIATFPGLWTWRAPLRKVRLAMRGCPVFFYTMSGIRKLLEKSGWRPVEIKTVGKLHFVVAE